MYIFKHSQLVMGVAAVALAVGVGRLAVAQLPSSEVVGEIANNEGYFVDGKTFKILKGKAPTEDASAQFAKFERMGAKEMGPGLLVFRYNDKLYLVDLAPLPSPQR